MLADGASVKELKKQAYPIVVLLLSMWLVWIVDLILPADLSRLGLLPRTLQGLPGIVTMPFLHGGPGHLIANTIPLAILLGLMVASRRHAWTAVLGIILLSGALVWLFGRSGYHIGASGLIFGLIAYLITVGLREKQLVSIAIALLVGCLFGVTLVGGIVPRFNSAISWDGHLLGALSGIMIGCRTSRSINA